MDDASNSALSTADVMIMLVAGCRVFTVAQHACGAGGGINKM